MKKFISIVLILVLGFSSLSMSANAEFCFRTMVEDNNGKWYMADENGTAITQSIYDDPHIFGFERRTYYSEGYAAVEKDGKLGFIDLSGKEVIPFEYSDGGFVFTQFSEGLVWVDKDGKFGAIDKNGEVVIPFDYVPIELLTSNAWLPVVFKNGYAPVCKDGKYGFIDKNNNVVVPLKYDDVHSWIDGPLDHNGIARMVFGDEYVYVDMQGNEYAEYPGIHAKFDGEYYGLVDKNGNTVLPFEYTNIMYSQDGMFKVYKEHSWYGFVNAEGVAITGCVYGSAPWGGGNSGFSSDDYVVFKNERAKVEKDGKYGYIDKLGNEIIPIIYDEADNFGDGCASVKKDGKEFLIDIYGNEIECPTIVASSSVQRIEYSGSEVSVMLDGNLINFDQPPVIVDGRTLVPLRAIFEALGATVEWDGETQTVTSVKGEKTIFLTIGSSVLYLNGGHITLDVPAQIKNGHTLVPVRAISESFGVKVEWDDSTKTVILQNQ